jgi:hypothetical protein
MPSVTTGTTCQAQKGGTHCCGTTSHAVTPTAAAAVSAGANLAACPKTGTGNHHLLSDTYANHTGCPAHCCSRSMNPASSTLLRQHKLQALFYLLCIVARLQCCCISQAPAHPVATAAATAGAGASVILSLHSAKVCLLTYFTCSTQQGVGTPIRSQRKAHRGHIS